jgi:SAM-dependent methyltransferase
VTRTTPSTSPDEDSPTSALASAPGRATVETPDAAVRAAYARREARAADARYSWFDPGYVAMMHELEHATLLTLSRELTTPLDAVHVLDVGCGRGDWLSQLVKWGATPQRLTGVDLLPERVALARLLCAPGVAVSCASATRLPYVAHSFDVVLQATVMTSILDRDVRHAVAAEMARVLRPSGFILWYDFVVDNPRNRDVRGVTIREMGELFPGWRIGARRVTLAPPLLRPLARRSLLMAQLLSRVPLLRTHSLAVLRPPG